MTGPISAPRLRGERFLRWSYGLMVPVMCIGSYAKAFGLLRAHGGLAEAMARICISGLVQFTFMYFPGFWAADRYLRPQEAGLGPREKWWYLALALAILAAAVGVGWWLVDSTLMRGR